MKAIDLRQYEVEVDGKPETVDVKSSLANALFASPKIQPRELIARDVLARKIEAAGDEILLEEAEVEKIQDGLSGAAVNGRMFVELVRRVFEAPDVEVERKHQ